MKYPSNSLNLGITSGIRFQCGNEFPQSGLNTWACYTCPSLPRWVSDFVAMGAPSWVRDYVAMGAPITFEPNPSGIFKPCVFNCP